MNDPTRLIMVLTTVGSAEQAERLAGELVRRRLAACVQIDGPITSHYVWEDQVERGTEWRLSIKSTAGKLEMLSQAARELHDYDLPQWLVIREVEASPAYVDWVRQVTRTNQDTPS